MYMKVLHEQYHDNVPDDFDVLLKLPGVGRKSNLIMGDVFGKPIDCYGYTLYPSV